MSKKDLLSYLIESNASIPTTQIIISMAMAVILSMFIYWVYKKTYSGVMYSKNFNITIMLTAVVTSIVMMVIGSNLALSLGMVGALSIIRFRTAIKEPKDVGFLFWGVGVGLATGTGVYIVSVVGSIFIAIMLLIFNRGIYDDSCYLLVVKNEGADYKKIEKIISENSKKYKLKMKNSTSISDEVTYEIRLKNNSDSNMIKEIKSIKNVNSVNLISYNGEIAG